MTFHHPSVWALLLLVVVPVVWWRYGRGRRRGAVVFSSVAPLEAAGRSWASRLRWLVPAARGVALALLVLCLARPQKADEQTRIPSEGIAIQLVIDRSGSMRAQDFRHRGRPVSRLEVVKAVVEAFVGGGDGLPGRADDLVGLITFATWADTLCPLTLDHDHLVEAVRQTEISADERDRATAIGDAVALAVERMSGLEKRRGLGPDRAVKSKVIILLTDGEQTAGEIDPITAARMAAAFDIKLYTIGAGSDEGVVEIPDPLFGTRQTRVRIDEETLEQMAAATGGQYFRATDSDTLAGVYAQIDALERSEIDDIRYVDHAEVAVEPVRLAGVTLPPLAALVIVVLLIETLLASTRLRTLP